MGLLKTKYLKNRQGKLPKLKRKLFKRRRKTYTRYIDRSKHDEGFRTGDEF